MANGCVVWGLRTVIPETYRKLLLNLLHEAHPGIVRMKSLACSHLWWPELDEEIVKMISNCDTCNANAKNPTIQVLAKNLEYFGKLL